MLFGPEQPVEDRSNRWRNIITLVALGGGIVAAVSSFYWPGNQSLTEVSAVWRGLSAQLPPPAVVAKGGDALVAPPAVPSAPQPILVGTTSTIPALTARSILVKDHDTGVVLYAKDEYAKHSLASLTKLMSALVLLERHIDWATTTRVVADDIEDTHMYAGDTYTLDDLWHAALIGSSNKAVVTLVDATGWSRANFVERMNQKAKELGMSETHFVEPTGIDEQNMGTTSDLAILLTEALRHDEIRKALLAKEFTLYSPERKAKHHMWSTDWLLLGWIPQDIGAVLGGKTGYLPSAGYNFAMEMAGKDHQVIDVVVFGAAAHEERFTEARDIAAWVFQNYQWPKK